jgi:bacterioferritin-associated ferredoxin
MIICSCNVISDRDVRKIVASTAARPSSTAQVYDCLGCTVRCGQCTRSVRRVLDECSHEARPN